MTPEQLDIEGATKTTNSQTPSPASPPPAPQLSSSGADDGPEGKKNRGRPRKVDGSPTPKPKRETGSFEFRKPADEIQNVHAALDRMLDQEKELFERKKALAKRYEDEFRKPLKVEEPRHMLDAAAPRKPMPPEMAQALAETVATIPYEAMGLDSRPKPAAVKGFAQSLATLSSFYDVETASAAWLGLGVTALGVFGPAVAEIKQRKAGTWETGGKTMALAAGIVPA